LAIVSSLPIFPLLISEVAQRRRYPQPQNSQAALFFRGHWSPNQGPSFVPVPAGGKTLIVNNPLTYYVEPGGVPELTLQNAGSDATAFIRGYLVAIN
jgi:hypothetical protein